MTSRREQVARIIYQTHQRPPAPTWENASKVVRDWVLDQARNVLAFTDTTNVDPRGEMPWENRHEG